MNPKDNSVFVSILLLILGFWTSGCVPKWISQPFDDSQYSSDQYFTAVGIVHTEGDHERTLSDTRELAARRAKEMIAQAIGKPPEDEVMVEDIGDMTCGMTVVPRYYDDSSSHGNGIVYAFAVLDRKKLEVCLEGKIRELSQEAKASGIHAMTLEGQDPVGALDYYFRTYQILVERQYVMDALSKVDAEREKLSLHDDTGLNQLEFRMRRFVKSFFPEKIEVDHTISTEQDLVIQSLRVKVLAKTANEKTDRELQIAVREMPVHFEVMSDHVTKISPSQTLTDDQGFIEVHIERLAATDSDLLVKVNLAPNLSNYDHPATRDLVRKIFNDLSSQSVVYVLPPPLLAPPTNVRAELQDSEEAFSIRLIWELLNTTAVRGYTICRQESDFLEEFEEPSAMGGTCLMHDSPTGIFIDKEVRQGKSYRYAIATRNQKGIIGFFGQPTSVILMPPSVDRPQAQLDPVQAGILVSWQPAKGVGIEAYELYRSSEHSDERLLVEELNRGSGSHSYLDSVELIPGQTYIYRIRARNSQRRVSSLSGFSKSIEFHVQPAPIRNLHATVKGTNVFLEWESVQPPDFSHYEVSNNWVLSDTLPYQLSKITRMSRWVSRNIPSDAELKYEVCAVNSVGWRSCENIRAYSPPLPPDNIVVHDLGEGGVELKWDNPNTFPVIGFSIYRKITAWQEDFSLLEEIRLGNDFPENLMSFRFVDSQESLGITSYYLVALGAEGSQSFASETVVINRVDLTLKKATENAHIACRIESVDPLNALISFLHSHESLSSSLSTSSLKQQQPEEDQGIQGTNVCVFLEEILKPEMNTGRSMLAQSPNNLMVIADFKRILEQHMLKIVQSFRIRIPSIASVEVHSNPKTFQLEDKVSQPLQAEVMARKKGVIGEQDSEIPVINMPLIFQVHGIAGGRSVMTWATSNVRGMGNAVFILPVHLHRIWVEVGMNPDLGTFKQRSTREYVEILKKSIKGNIVSSEIPNPVLPPPRNIAALVSRTTSESLVQISWEKWESPFVQDYVVVRTEIPPHEHRDGMVPQLHCHRGEAKPVPQFFLTSTRDSNVGDGKSFIYCVATRNRDGNFGTFGPLLVHMPPLLEQSPQLGFLQDTKQEGIQVAWEPGKGHDIVEYAIHRKWEDQIQKILTFRDVSGPLIFFDSNQENKSEGASLIPGQTYSYSILAKNSQGRWSRESPQREIVYHVQPYPIGSPRVQTLGRKFLLSWKGKQPIDFGYFTVKRKQLEEFQTADCENISSEQEPSGSEKIGIPDWIDQAPLLDAWIHYEVCAVNEAMEAWKNCNCTTAPGFPKPPVVKEVKVHNGKTVISWENANVHIGIYKYIVSRRFGEGGRFRRPKSLTEQRYEDKYGPTDSNPVYYRIVAVSMSGLESEAIECRVVANEDSYCR